mmetsp:Transcript_5406/g.15696  ORF Transcript_5406/g.15696 Transcript_5406/m.15696 type:complete len:583 (+) Transcript_5406:90-1838(+)
MLTSIARKVSASLVQRSSLQRLVPAIQTAIGTRSYSAEPKPLIPELLRLKKAPRTGTMTKIVCTIGPSTDTPEKMSELLRNGMHVARLNFSHAGADYTYPETLFKMLREAKGNHESMAVETSSGAMPNNLRAILVDTKGPEIRTGNLPGDKEVSYIEVDAKVILTIEDVSGEPVPEDGDTDRILNIDYQSICKTVSVGKMVLLDDGLIALEVMEIDPNEKYIVCKALNGGPIKKNKGVNLPGMELDLPALTEKDKRDLKWACEMGADYIAASFIRTGANVRSVIAYLNRCIASMPEYHGFTRVRPLVISKIENKEGVDNFDEILKESDGIMVARGDLGVEIPYSIVFAAQKMMVSKCNEVGKPVIVATQMLDSMIRNPRPTRAEVTDVGTAVLDGTDTVMLSGETAAGAYPIEAVKSMASILVEADHILTKEGKMSWNQALHESLTPPEQEMDGVAASCVKAASVMNVSKIIMVSREGKFAKAVARHKPHVPVLAFCTDPQVARRLQLHRAITPIMLHTTLPGTERQITSTGLLRQEAIETAVEMGFVEKGDRVIVVDQTLGKSSHLYEVANNMKVVTLTGV